MTRLLQAWESLTIGGRTFREQGDKRTEAHEAAGLSE